MREVNCPDNLEDGGNNAMVQRTGNDQQCIETPYDQLNPDQITRSDVDNGIYFKRLPHIWPVNAPDTWLLNIAKLKIHPMGLKLCAKNLQGIIVKNYKQHSSNWGEPLNVNSTDVQTNAFSNIETNYNQHVSQGIPRWDRPRQSGEIKAYEWTPASGATCRHLSSFERYPIKPCTSGKITTGTAMITCIW